MLSWTRAPLRGRGQAGFQFSGFGFKFSVFGFRFPVFGFRFSVFGLGFRFSGFMYLRAIALARAGAEKRFRLSGFGFRDQSSDSR